jgi:hypothetical protein
LTKLTRKKIRKKNHKLYVKGPVFNEEGKGGEMKEKEEEGEWGKIGEKEDEEEEKEEGDFSRNPTDL